ncbi:MAG: YfhO family protein [Candidatus Rokubacteria bacterium]|nr:YfhO family protein [Candidatus Rokubacteria bacterium]
MGPRPEGRPAPPGEASAPSGRVLRLLLVLAAFGLALGAYYWEILRPGASRSFGGDFASYFYPVTAYAAADLAAGRLVPHWSPHVGVGYPLLADIEAAVLYPPRLLLALLGGHLSYQALEAYALGHLLLAGLGMLTLLRRIGLGLLAASAGGLAFMLSGFFWGHAAHLTILQSSAWLPWIVVAFDRAVRGRSAGWTAATGGLFALLLLGGHPQIGFYTAVALAGLALGWPLADERPTRWGRLAPLARLVIAVALGLLLTLPQLLPTAELIRATTREAPPLEFLLADSLPPWQLATLLIPRVFIGTPLWQSMDEVYGYLGVGPLLLAAVAFALRRDRWTWLLGGLGLAALAVALGAYNPLYRHGLQWAPGFNLFRAPARALLFVDFAAAGLAGLGLEALSRPRPGPRARRLAAGLLAIGGLALVAVPLAPRLGAALVPWVSPAFGTYYRGFALLILANVILLLVAVRVPRRVSWWGSGLVGLLLLDLFFAPPRGLPWHPSPPEGFWPARLPNVERLLADPEPFRVWSEGTLVGLGALREANAGLVYRIPVLSHYTSLALWRFERLRDLVAREGWRYPALFDLLNVKYLAVQPDRAERLVQDERFRPLTDTLWENRRVLPRVFVVEDLVVAGRIADPEALLTLDPRRAALVEDEPPCAGALRRADQAGTPFPVEIPRYAPETIRVEARLDRPGFLVLTDAHYPGWQAAVDGRPVKIYRTNFLFRGLCLEPGHHRVEFRYRARAFWRGATAALAALAAAVVAVAVLARPSREAR